MKRNLEKVGDKNENSFFAQFVSKALLVAGKI